MLAHHLQQPDDSYAQSARGLGSSATGTAAKVDHQGEGTAVKTQGCVRYAVLKHSICQKLLDFNSRPLQGGQGHPPDFICEGYLMI